MQYYKLKHIPGDQKIFQILSYYFQILTTVVFNDVVLVEVIVKVLELF